jgi:hypothetical protein
MVAPELALKRSINARQAHKEGLPLLHQIAVVFSK